jgi:hypothetical protein
MPPGHPLKNFASRLLRSLSGVTAGLARPPQKVESVQEGLSEASLVVQRVKYGGPVMTSRLERRVARIEK